MSDDFTADMRDLEQAINYLARHKSRTAITLSESGARAILRLRAREARVAGLEGALKTALDMLEIQNADATTGDDTTPLSRSIIKARAALLPKP